MFLSVINYKLLFCDMCLCDVRLYDGYVMLFWGFGEDGGFWVKDFVGDRFDEGYSDYIDGVGLG